MSIPSESSSNNTQSTAPNISNEGRMQSIDLTENEDVNVKEIIVHRQNLRVDLVEAFKTVSLSDTIRFIIINGVILGIAKQELVQKPYIMLWH